MSETALGPDQEQGSPHPREVFDLFGHEAGELALCDSLRGGRPHHAWLFVGPKGVGKATLAYRFARAILGAQRTNPQSLSSAPDDPTNRKITAGSHPDLRTATRFDVEDFKVKRDVSVASIRDITQFFSMKADGQNGARVAIIDSADDMNPSAANALLKTLEEPPAGGTLILISHAPGRLLPTIRSRCRKLVLSPLSETKMKEAVPDASQTVRALAMGCPGRARTLASLDAEKMYKMLSRHLAGLPRAPLDEALALSEMAGNSDKFVVLFDMLEDWLARAGRAGLGMPIAEIEPGESAVLGRLGANAALDGPALAWEKLRETRHGVDALNLDRGLATLDALRWVRAQMTPLN
jgi:DNA polymerase III subunit delta'